MKSAIVLLSALILFSTAQQLVAAPSIDFWTEDGAYALCHLDIPLGESRTWTIVAHRNDMPEFDAVEFRVTGWPAGYVHVVTPNPQLTLEYGDPFQSGCVVAFPTCPTDDAVTLYSIQTFNFAAAIGAAISVEPHASPSNPNFPCPNFQAGCGTNDTAECATPSTFYVNEGSATPPANPVPADVATDVGLDAQLSWSAGHPGSECAVGVPGHRVYFGTSSDPPLVGELSPLDNTVFDPGALDPDTTYFWRIEAIDTGFGISGPVWSFTTGGPVNVESLSWNEVKQLYR